MIVRTRSARTALRASVAAACCALVIWPVPALSTTQAVVVNGVRLQPADVVELDGALYIALRAVTTSLGAQAQFDSKKKQVTVTTLLRQVVMRLNDVNATVNGDNVKMASPARQVGGRVLVPLRGLSSVLGGSIKIDTQRHEIAVDFRPESANGYGTPPPGRSADTLEGTVVAVTVDSAPPAVEIDVKGDQYTITVPAGTKIQFRDTHGATAGLGVLAQVKPGDTLLATLDAGGHLLSIADVFAGTAGTIASVSGTNMVLTNGKVIAADANATSVERDGHKASMADLKAGDLVTVRSDPKTNKVRTIVALTPGGMSTSATATPNPQVSSAGDVKIDGVSDNAQHPFRVGELIKVSMDGTPGGTAAFDLSDAVLDSPMKETRPGHYEGAYAVTVGTNVVDAPILVKLSKAGLTAHAVGPDPLSILTEPPQVKETAPLSGAHINTARPSIYVTFATIGGKGMDPGSLQLLVDGKDVTSQATKTSAFITYFPAADLRAGTISVEVKGTDVAGNPLDYSWSFVIANGS
jgi:Copper amine oxidase N-terminal domain